MTIDRLIHPGDPSGDRPVQPMPTEGEPMYTEPTTYPHGHGDLAEGEPVAYPHGHSPVIDCLCGDVFTTTEDMALHLWMAHGHEVPPRDALDVERLARAVVETWDMPDYHGNLEMIAAVSVPMQRLRAALAAQSKEPTP